MIHVRNIMSTMEGVQYCGGTQITNDFYPHGTEHPPRHSRYPFTSIMISHHGTQGIPHGADDILHGTEHPHCTEYTLYRVIFERDILSSDCVANSALVKSLVFF